MPTEKTLWIAGSAGAVGAIIKAVGQAIGYSRRLQKVEKDVSNLKHGKGNYLLKTDHDDKCNLAKELTETKLAAIEGKIDMVLERLNHLEYSDK